MSKRLHLLCFYLPSNRDLLPVRRRHVTAGPHLPDVDLLYVDLPEAAVHLYVARLLEGVHQDVNPPYVDLPYVAHPIAVHLVIVHLLTIRHRHVVAGRLPHPDVRPEHLQNVKETRETVNAATIVASVNVTTVDRFTLEISRTIFAKRNYEPFVLNMVMFLKSH